jgi:FlaA1/EpsC-like NDP-sugar epimerase
MRHHHVETVYHAAAYKHVPLVEANPFEGVINNSLGTYHTAVAARDAGVETFVLVSRLCPAPWAPATPWCALAMCSAAQAQ